MRNLIISLIIIAVFLEISGLIWSAKDDGPSETYVRLTQPPERRIENPLRNGYFLLLGLTSSPQADPTQTGFDIWREAEGGRGHRHFDYSKPGRTSLRILVEAAEAFPAWQAMDPVTEFQKPDALFRTTMDRYAILTQRYAQFLGMAFEDWGFGHIGTPRFEELLTVHRLYVAEGFARQFKTGVERLQQDITVWRMILKEARTTAIKTLAAIMIDDDISLLATLANQRGNEPLLVSAVHTVGRPMTPEEYSLRWPMQHQFVLGTARSSALRLDLNGGEAETRTNQEWVARRASLVSNAFLRIEHPVMKTMLGVTLESQRLWDTYAAYYDLTIKAEESVRSPLPKLEDIARTSKRTLLDTLLRPLEFEPDWDQFVQRLVETDARLRLVTLQVLLRQPSVMKTIPGRLAEVGPAYYDPFTGLPMLWSETQGKVYSIGKDRIDDGGDANFDISAPVVRGPGAPAPLPSKRPAVGRAVRSGRSI